MTAPAIVLAALAVGLAVALTHLVRGHARGRPTPGGILIGDTGAYDKYSRVLFGSFYRGIASDIAAATSPAATVLEVGCGPGHLSIRLARDHRLDVTGLDLDPAMIQRARKNAERSKIENGERSKIEGREPTFVEGDVAALPFDDSSFDLVVSTLAMHHWPDTTAGLREIERVLRPGGRALIWDINAGLPFHAHAPDPAEQVRAGPLRVVSASPWRWPWRLTFSQRLELARS